MSKRTLLSWFFVLCLVFSPLFSKFHPEIEWKTVADKKFTVVFPAGYEAEGAYTLEIAGEIYDRLQQLWGRGVQGRVRILLTDVYDFSNGSATFFPFNLVEIYLFNPPPDSTIGSYSEWLYMALTHELTHIFNLNAGSGFTYFLRKIFGSNPLLYPVAYAPVWVSEGLAIYGESRLNRGGRMDTPDFDIMIQNIAQGGKIPGWPYIFGDPTPWPGPGARYLYGAKFVQFLVDAYGEEKIPELVDIFARYPVPITADNRSSLEILTIKKRFQRVFGKDLFVLWDEFIGSVGGRHVGPATAGNHRKHQTLTVLTDSGIYKKYPTFGGGRKIFYVNQNYREYPGIYELDLVTGKSRRRLKKAGITGLYYDRQGGKIYFSALRYHRSFYRFSDLYRFDPGKKTLSRLSDGDRLLHPVKSGNGLYCVKRVKARSYLCRYDLETRRHEILSEGFDSLAYPSVSPDQKRVAVSLKQRNRNWRIGIFDTGGQLRKVLPVDGVKSYYPAWKNPREIYFITQYMNRYRLALYHLPTDTLRVFNDPRLPDIRYFSLPPRPPKDRILVSFFDADGFNLGLGEASKLESQRIVVEKDKNAANHEEARKFPEKTGKIPLKTGKYRIAPEILPQYVSPSYRYAGSEIQPGIFLSGHDILSKHSFTMEGFYGFSSRTLNFNFDYTYDGLYPTLGFNYADLSSLNRSAERGEYLHNSRRLEFAALYPLFFGEKQRAYLYGDIHFERIGDRFSDPPETRRARLNGVTLALLFGTEKRYYDSISNADGMRLSLSYSRELKGLGSDYDIHTASLEWKHYVSLARPNTLALRLGAADSWGEAKRLFYMGGAESKAGYPTAGSNLFNLMRGYPSGYFFGTGGYILNLEYRISLFKIEKVFLVFRSIERLYLSLFTDIGNLWEDKKKVNPAYSLGLELNLVAYLGDEKLNLSAGVALGRNPYHKPVLYLRLGNSF